MLALFFLNIAMKHAICVYLSFLFLLNLYGQQSTFSKVFSNFPLNAENSWSLSETNGGYYLLSATSCLDDPNRTCSSIAKVDTTGNIVWAKIYQLRPEVNQILERDEKLYLAGQNTSGDSSQILLYCLDKEGNLLWQNTYGDTTVREGNPKIAFMGDYILVVCNKARQVGPGTSYVQAFVIDQQGNLLHEYSLCQQCADSAIRGVSCDDEGTCLVTFQYCLAIEDCLFYHKQHTGVVSMSPLSNQNWSVELPLLFLGNGASRAHKIDTNLIAISWLVNAPDQNQSRTPPAIYFADTSGHVYDTIPFYNISNKTLLNFAPVFGNGLVIGGFEQINFLTAGGTASPVSAWFLRMDGMGEILWERNYYDTTYQGKVKRIEQVIPTKDGGYIACGTIVNKMTGVSEAHNWLIKLDTMGCLTPSCDSVTYITVATQEPLLLNGIDFKITPNPAHEKVTVLLPQDCKLQGLHLNLLDQQGKMQKRVPLITLSQSVSVADLQSGLYFLVLTRDNEIVGSEKIVIQH
jgi:Secretion system C-terminal sorting domain